MTDETFFNALREVINPGYLCAAHAGVLEHVETHRDGSTSRFCLKVSAKMLAFSLDKPGRNPFDVLAQGWNLRNDLTVVCRADSGQPLVFVIECKNSGSTLGAQRQIEHGMAFCEYLFKLLLVGHGIRLEPRCMGVLAFRPKSPPKGVTRPQFVTQGKHGVLRAEWPLAVQLPLRELVRAAQAAS